MEKKAESWLGIPGFDPSFSSDVGELGVWCAEIERVVKGERVLGVLSGYDLFYDCWNLNFPLLLRTEGHCVDVMNFKFDEVTVGIDRIDPAAPIIQNWEEWVYEWREYPCDPVVGKPIRGIRPTVEEEERYMNHGWLNGIEIRFDDGLFLIQNGLDTNLLWWVDADGNRICLGDGDS